jgi:hypothetical protein
VFINYPRDLIKFQKEENKLKKIKFELHDATGEIVLEDEIVLEEGDRLILQPPANVTMESMHSIFHHAKSVLQGQNELMVLPQEVEIKVLKIR